jgi:hypothetical protein
MQARLFSREVLPFLAGICALVGIALLLDALLHASNAVWIGRYLGIPGTLLIIGSAVYSLRKHHLIRSGQPERLLRWHEGLAFLGALLVLVHAGIHFNAILGWLAVAAMMVNVVSGLTGKFLLGRSRRRLAEAQQSMRRQGLSQREQEERTHWDSLTFDAVRKWRVIHLPITLAFAGLALAHIIAVFLFWGWK